MPVTGYRRFRIASLADNAMAERRSTPCLLWLPPLLGAVSALILCLFAKRRSTTERSLPIAPASSTSRPSSVGSMQSASPPGGVAILSPQIDLLAAIPLLRRVAHRRHKYLTTVITSWLALLLPLAVTAAFAGTLLTRRTAAAAEDVLRAKHLRFLADAVAYWARSDVDVSFLSDRGVLLILAVLLPAFLAVSVAFYSTFGPAVLGLHVGGVHEAFRTQEDYNRIVKRYMSAFANPRLTAAAWTLAAILAGLLAGARWRRSWWGSYDHGLAFCAYIVVATCASFYLAGVGTFKGWVAIRFCREFFNRSAPPLALSPWHPDGFNGLAPLGRALAAVYAGALLSGCCLFVAYRFGVFGAVTWPLAALVIFGSVDYAVFISVPTVLILRKCAAYRATKLQQLNNVIQHSVAHMIDYSSTEAISGADVFAESTRLQATLALQGAYRNMSIIPLSVRLVTVSMVYYAAQIAQVIAVILYAHKQ